MDWGSRLDGKEESQKLAGSQHSASLLLGGWGCEDPVSFASAAMNSVIPSPTKKSCCLKHTWLLAFYVLSKGWILYGSIDKKENFLRSLPKKPMYLCSVMCPLYSNCFGYKSIVLRLELGLGASQPSVAQGLCDLWLITSKRSGRQGAAHGHFRGGVERSIPEIFFTFGLL